MKIHWRRGIVELDPARTIFDRLLARCWWSLQSPRKRRSKGQPPWQLKLMSKRNLAVWALLWGWGIYYFTFQLHTFQEPWYPGGALFTIQPSLWLQEHRHIVLDYLLAYSWVVIFISVGSLFFLVALASERDFHRYGLAFWATWITQYTLQLSLNIASPMRNSDSGLEFIRKEVFPWSENLVGIKYGAFPSGHIGVTLLVFLIARERQIPWVQKTAIFCFGLLFWAILYLGEHYLIDAVASMLLYPPIFYAVLRLIPPSEQSSEDKDRETSGSGSRSVEQES